MSGDNVEPTECYPELRELIKVTNPLTAAVGSGDLSGYCTPLARYARLLETLSGVELGVSELDLLRRLAELDRVEVRALCLLIDAARHTDR